MSLLSANRLCPLLPPISTSRRTGFVHGDGAQALQQWLQPLPEPDAQQLRGRILEAGDVVQGPVVEVALEQRLDPARDPVEIHEPSHALVERTRHRDLD